jgi:hypothetical protein
MPEQTINLIPDWLSLIHDRSLAQTLKVRSISMKHPLSVCR